jgi:hypothetical protein
MQRYLSITLTTERAGRMNRVINTRNRVWSPDGRSTAQWCSTAALQCGLLIGLSALGLFPAAWAGAGAVDHAEQGAAEANGLPAVELAVLIYAKDVMPWNTLSAQDREALEQAVGEAFQRGTERSSRAVWCAQGQRCDAGEGAQLRLELDQPYVGKLRSGFSLTSSGNPRSQDFGKVTLLPMSCVMWSDAAVQSTPRRVEQAVSATLLQAGSDLETTYLAKQIYGACEPALPANPLAVRQLATASETTADGTVREEVTGEEALSKDGDEPAYIFDNAESTVILRFGNNGQNR